MCGDKAGWRAFPTNCFAWYFEIFPRLSGRLIWNYDNLKSPILPGARLLLLGSRAGVSRCSLQNSLLFSNNFSTLSVVDIYALCPKNGSTFYNSSHLQLGTGLTANGTGPQSSLHISPDHNYCRPLSFGGCGGTHRNCLLASPVTEAWACGPLAQQTCSEFEVKFRGT